ncbi:hypothetical protein FH966_08425 [Lentibacillus cibarius]|uniref:Membrane protein YkvI n=1 Tax=Lentibacillus cibarius TaxID=2583219 RepID=A0A549YIJ5_9BACI|nr:hypothetical protein [Lentibacillus cibarius]TRM11707.1 hypothetical protein FH966_08425 [Lentibacillus cibarius]
MKKILQIASAFIGIIVGAGFASGQEILQYFTSYGYLGTIGAIVGTALFAFLGMTIMRVGTRTQAVSHKEAIYTISGRYLGVIVDYVLIFTLFGVGVVMIAGAGSIPSQQFGLPSAFGIIVMTILVIAVVMMRIDRVVKIIGSITPFLIFAVLLISAYSLFTMETPFSGLVETAKEQSSALSSWSTSAVNNWFISAVNYVSFNLAVGASMSLLMAGNERNERVSAIGGLLGGLGIGILIVLSHLAVFSKVDVVASFDMPMLKIVDDISPVLGNVYAIILFGMIFNTAVSMLFSLTARFTSVGTSRHKLFALIAGAVMFFLSFAGFKDLVAFFYPLIGALGLFLILALIAASFRMPAKNEQQKRASS